MYKCKRCGKTFDEEPPLQNACGTFCATCKQIIHTRAAEAHRRNTPEGRCVWCRELLTTANRQPGKSSIEAVCIRCETGRRWLLECVRQSPHTAQYVARIEKR